MTVVEDVNIFEAADEFEVGGEYVTIDGGQYYCIANSHLMPEFFVSLVGASDHWMFISSNGALSAGRRNAESALFPYYCSDKLLDMSESTGAKTIVRVPLSGGEFALWEPFSGAPSNRVSIRRNFYKNGLGNRIILEEINDSLQLAFSYQWTFGKQFGFIRSCRLRNLGAVSQSVAFVDGIQNILPSGIGQDFQSRFSNLGDAYKKSELVNESRLGVHYLSSIPTDRAEPNEGLRATTAWHEGLADSAVLLSSKQLDAFRSGFGLFQETDIRAQRGAYFVASEMPLAADEKAEWRIVADVNQDQTDVVNLNRRITDSSNIGGEISQDIADNADKLLTIISSADGRQLGSDRLRTHRHQSNVLFNVMRGGLPLDGYQIDKSDLLAHIQNFNGPAFERHCGTLEALPDKLELKELQSQIQKISDRDLTRIVAEYLPFTFSRRHGDPTRPWNAFSIDLLSEDGSQKLSYEGNWRDIFQNWEGLALSYPNYVTGMVLRFLNSSTADGYNPYRLTKDGFDWEAPEPGDPWANIGYWGDHQIVYLLKLLEWSRSFEPERLSALLNDQACAYAEVPYRIRSFKEIVKDPQDTIEYDHVLAGQIEERVAEMGADGKLLQCISGGTLHVSLLEKLLVPALAKLTNFVPEGGVWLNTQRPEWNDANNALVGSGLSMVTTCYLRRFLVFMIDWLSDSKVPETCAVSPEVVTLLRSVQEAVGSNAELFSQPMSDQDRRSIVDALSGAGADYRSQLYSRGLSQANEELSTRECCDFFQQCLVMIDHTIRSNRRTDGLYHSYNLLSLSDGSARVRRLYEMLEGQVAVLSSGLLSASEAVEVLDALRNSRMYRSDQQSYTLYPDRELPKFLEKNRISADSVAQSELVQRLIANGDTSAVRVDVDGTAHFNGDIRNAADFTAVLDELAKTESLEQLVDAERERLLDVFEETFNHADFTGRSGTFFAYEGLGSIYWHMVSKLALAVLENVISARESLVDPAVVERLHRYYREIRDDLGLKKTPEEYGAMPCDPYSHTPRHAGAQQPGMTGQVKEDVLCRWAEMGVRIRNGQLHFSPALFECEEFLENDSTIAFYDLAGELLELPIVKGEFAFTLCQVPVIYHRGEERKLVIGYTNSEAVDRQGLALTDVESSSVFSRRGEINRIDVYFEPSSSC